MPPPIAPSGPILPDGSCRDATTVAAASHTMLPGLSTRFTLTSVTKKFLTPSRKYSPEYGHRQSSERKIGFVVRRQRECRICGDLLRTAEGPELAPREGGGEAEVVVPQQVEMGMAQRREPRHILIPHRDALAPGSYLAIARGTVDGAPPAVIAQVERLYTGTTHPVKFRPRAAIAPFFAGLTLVDPGLVFVPRWRPEADDDLFLDDPARSLNLVGVGRKA